MRHCIVCVVALLSMLTAPAMAQESSPALDEAVNARARIRVTMLSHEQVSGTVVALRSDSVVLTTSPAGGTRALRRADVVSIERSTGMTQHRVRGVVLGLLVGAGAGAGIGYASADHGSCDGCFNGADEFAGGVVGGSAGGLLGATIGAALGWREREQWRQVLGNDAVRVGVGPAASKRVALNVSLRL